MQEPNIEAKENNRTYDFVSKRLETVISELSKVIPELLSVEDYSGITSVASIMTQVEIQARLFESRRNGGFGGFDINNVFKFGG